MSLLQDQFISYPLAELKLLKNSRIETKQHLNDV